MNEDIKWIIGLTVPIGGILVMAFRNLAARISSSNSEVYRRIDEVKDKYVRRDDLDGHLKQIDRRIGELDANMQKQHDRIIGLLTEKHSEK